MKVLRTRPEPPPHYSDDHLDKGRNYQDRLEASPGAALMWRLEQRAIPAMLSGVAPATALDFATGTGRIARLLKATFPDCRVVGADISRKMLSAAEAEKGGVEYVHFDVREPTEALQPNSFDLVTAFRFFSNADLALRSQAADQLSKLVTPGGLLLTNNHRNFWSPTYVVQRLLGNEPVGMLNSELVDLFTSRGFAVEAHISLGVSPHTEVKSLLPWWAVRGLERLNYRCCSGLHSAGYNTLYLFRRIG
jgi:SAM-dependent methyltransferase